MKTKNVFIVFILLIFSSISISLVAQECKRILDLEYEGPIEKHVEILLDNIVDCQSYLQKGEHVAFLHYSGYPLFMSYQKRIESLVTDYLKKNAKITKRTNSSGRECNIYELSDCFYSYNDCYTIFNKGAEHIAEKYLEAIIYTLGVLSTERSRATLSFEEDEEFANLVVEAAKNGIKKTATKDAFYDKWLALELARGVVYIKLINLLDSDRSLAYKVIHIADSYIALEILTDYLKIPSARNDALERVLKKY